MRVIPEHLAFIRDHITKLSLCASFAFGVIAITPAEANRAAQLGTSFDCARDTSPSAILVCNTDQARRADLDQLQKYYTLRHVAPAAQSRFRDQIVNSIIALREECNRQAPEKVSMCVTGHLTTLRQNWIGAIIASGNQEAIEESQLPVDQLLRAQLSLQQAGYLPANARIDGLFGGGTRGAVSRFQSDRGIQPSGFVSVATQRALQSVPTNSGTRVVEPSAAAPSGTSPGQTGGTPTSNAPPSLWGQNERQAGATNVPDTRQSSELAQPPARTLPQERSQSILSSLERLQQQQGPPQTIQPSAVAPSATTRAQQNPPIVPAQISRAPSSSSEIYAIIDRQLSEGFARCWRMDRGLVDSNVELRVVLDAQGRVRDVRPGSQGVPRDPAVRTLYEQARRAMLSPECGPILSPAPPTTLEFFMYYNRHGLIRIENFVERMTDSDRVEYGRRLARTEELRREEREQQERRREAQDQRREAQEREAAHERAAQRAQAEQLQIQAAQLERSRREAVERSRANIREANDLVRNYQSRPKTLLEQVMNYTSFGQQDGSSIGETTRFWVSGHNGTHRCVLTRMTAVNEQRASGSGANPFTALAFALATEIEIGSEADRLVDIREFSDQGFRINSERGRVSHVGDERRRIAASPEAVIDRLQNAWSLAFRECPGRRSAF